MNIEIIDNRKLDLAGKGYKRADDPLQFDREVLNDIRSTRGKLYSVLFDYGGGTPHPVYWSSVDRLPVTDRLPEDQEEVLVCTRSKNGARNIDKGYMAIDRLIHRGRAEDTHWMPLPNFPKE